MLHRSIRGRGKRLTVGWSVISLSMLFDTAEELLEPGIVVSDVELFED